MNLKPLVIEKLKEFSEMSEFEDYSVGELLYSIFTQMNSGIEFKKSSLLKIPDGSLYTMIEKAIKKESEEVK